MTQTVGIAELRQNLSRYLKLVKEGERIIVTDHNKPVAEIGPPVEQMSKRDRLIASGRLKPAKNPGGLADLVPMTLPEGMRPASEVLLEMRDEERS